MATIDGLVRAVYAALGAGDAAALDEALAPEFVGHVADGMPVGGGRHEGPVAMREQGWWAIGRQFAVVAEPEEFIPCDDGRLLVVGRYRGTRRADSFEVDAAFSHLWTEREGRLVELHQVTDTRRWTP
jgi:2-(1,2-epoxy-1,2-dihydrophenyl)acetyl-CoA isomerase